MIQGHFFEPPSDANISWINFCFYEHYEHDKAVKEVPHYLC